jgi:putative hydrolase of the HAD superfamily
MTIRAVLFDLYDTLLYARPTGTREKALEVIAAAGIPKEDWLRGWRTQFEISRRGEIRFLRQMVQQALTNAGGDASHTCLVNELTGLLLVRMIPIVYEDAVEGLIELRKRDYRLGLVSNIFAHQTHWIEEFDLSRYFDNLILSCDVGLSKPDPEIYRLAAGRLSVDPKECVFVGDGMDHELSGAKAAGMNAVRIERDLRDKADRTDLLDPNFDYRVCNLAELLAWLPSEAGSSLPDAD